MEMTKPAEPNWIQLSRCARAPAAISSCTCHQCQPKKASHAARPSIHVVTSRRLPCHKAITAHRMQYGRANSRKKTAAKPNATPSCGRLIPKAQAESPISTPAQSTGIMNKSPRTVGSKGPVRSNAQPMGVIPTVRPGAILPGAVSPRLLLLLTASKAIKSSANANPPSSALPNTTAGNLPSSHTGSGVRQLNTLRVG